VRLGQQRVVEDDDVSGEAGMVFEERVEGDEGAGEEALRSDVTRQSPEQWGSIRRLFLPRDVL